MKSTAVAALLAATIGLAAALPAVAAGTTATITGGTSMPAAMQDRNGPDGMHHMMRHDGPGMGMGMGKGMGMGRGGLLMLACSDKGAEELEIALVRLSHRLDLTDAQKPLFDAFRTKALTTATSFADSCKAAMPDTSAGKPDLLAHLKAGLAVDEARLSAMTAVLPDFEALYNSLTDAQKASIQPHGGWFGGKGDGGMGDRDGGMGRMMRPPAPGRS